MHRPRRNRRRSQCTTVFAAAFGLGLLLSLFFSVRLALFLAAILLIYLGLSGSRC